MGKYRDMAEKHMRSVCCGPEHMDEHCDSFEEGAEFAEKRIYDLINLSGALFTNKQDLIKWLKFQPVDLDAVRKLGWDIS